MNTKKIVLLAFVAPALWIPSVSHASPLISIGDNADIFFDGSGSVQWTSNVFRKNAGAQDDLIYTLSPGFELNVGRGLSNADFSVVTRYDIVRYADLGDLDNETFHIAASGSYRTSRLELGARVSFDEIKGTTAADSAGTTIVGLIERESTRASVNGEYNFSPKFSFGAGVNYDELEYTTNTDSFPGHESFTVPLDLFYELTPKVDLSVGYQYRNREVDDKTGDFVDTSFDSDSHFFNVGARGELLPKLNGHLKVGYRENEIDYAAGGSADKGALGVDANLTWSATPKLSTKLTLSRDFGVGGDGSSTEVSSARLGASYSIDTNWSASAYGKYTLREYTPSGREDNQYSLGARFTYVLNQQWRFSGGYGFIENDSSTTTASYETHTFDLTASLRY